MFRRIIFALDFYFNSFMERWFFSLALITFFISCTSPASEKGPNASHEKTAENNISRLKDFAQQGDLVVRMTDDLISEQIKFLNEKEKIYSHAGIIIMQNGEPFVCNISPNDPTNDTIQIEPVDSFLNPAKNLACALYRYEINNAERASLKETLIGYKQKHITFDWLYDIATDDKMYCAELIEKALRMATNDRISIRQTNIPAFMQPTVFAFFKKQQVTKKMIADRKIITIDNLYLRKDCKKIMSFPLKYLPA